MRRPVERLMYSLTTENLWLHVLHLLKKPRYAYEIKDLVSGVAVVTVYAVLYKLEIGGYVKKSFVKSGRGPERKYYAITPKGIAELRRAKKYIRLLAESL